MQPFGIETEILGEVSVMRLFGRMQLADTEEVETAVQTALERGRSKIVVDVTELACLHSAGIGMLLELSGTVRERGGRVVISGANAAMRDMLRTLGVERILDLRDTKDQAVKELRG
jgi:anti-sigma B factor antagonist